MGIIDRLLELATEEDLTETIWWTETIFRGLEQAGAVENRLDDAAPLVGMGELDTR